MRYRASAVGSKVGSIGALKIWRKVKWPDVHRTPQNVTNEPKLDENVSIDNIQETIAVTANPDLKSALDSIFISIAEETVPVSLPPPSKRQRPGARMINTSFPQLVKLRSVDVMAATGSADDQHLLPPPCEGGARGGDGRG